MRFFDTHCHLQTGRLLPCLGRIMENAYNIGVTHLVCCATNERDWNSVLEISKIDFRPFSNPGSDLIPVRKISVIPALGIHPWYMAGASPDWEARLDGLLLAHPAACVGEIGLDHGVDPRTDEAQDDFFIRQLALAIRRNRPVSVHCLKAWARIIEILGKEGIPAAGAIIHSYSGPPDLVPRLEELGCSLSFSGAITRTRNRRGVESLARVSLKRIVFETDSPDLVPFGVANPVNEPANIEHVVRKASEIRGVSCEALSETAFENARKIFLPGR
jgi:TatD DNase family protein